MKNSQEWRPTKFVYRRGKLIASRDRREVAVSSRLNSDIVASFYAAGIPKHVRGYLLDLGCGKVPLHEAYRNFITASMCVDWGNSPHGNQHLDLECDLTQPLPLADGAFDTIILSDVLEHIPEPRELWSEMTRVLAAGGKILMNVPFMYWLHERPYDYYRYTEFALRRFAEQAGLKVVEFAAIGGAPEVLADILAKNIVRVPWVGNTLAALIQWTVSLSLKTKLGRRISTKTALVFPIGYFLVLEKPAS